MKDPSSSKKEQRATESESDEEVKENYESIKSRLRPRYPVNYSDSVKRKLNEEGRQGIWSR